LPEVVERMSEVAREYDGRRLGRADLLDERGDRGG
jgi:hypothetical protein